MVIAKSPCLVDKSIRHAKRPQAVVADTCSGCRVCSDKFECPALVYDEVSRKVSVDVMICSGCGVCLDVCPLKAIRQGVVQP